MADLFWNAPSSPAYYTDAANWRVGASFGPVSPNAPTAADSVWFSPSSSTIGCEFNSHVNVTSFTANDPNGSFTLAPTFTSNLEITVTDTFSIAAAGINQRSIFALMNTGLTDAAVKLFTQPSAGGSTYVASGGFQLGRIIVNGAINGTTYFAANQPGGITIPPFKCYVLQINSGVAEFLLSDCGGLHLGYPGSSPLFTVLQMTGSLYSELDARFPSAQPIIMYGGCLIAKAYPAVYTLTWANDTQIHVRGYATTVQLKVVPTPSFMGVPEQPGKLPYVYNYLGENAAGAAVGSGGTIIFSSPYFGGGAYAPIYLQGLTCTAAGSVSGLFNRGIELYVDPLYIQVTEIQFPGYGSASTTVFNLAGAPSNPVTFRNTPGVPSGSGYRGRLNFLNIVTPNVTTSYTLISGIDAVPFGAGQYLAYTVNGNVDLGNNVGWIFEQSSSGFLAFFS